MPKTTGRITPEDILPPAVYAAARKDHRARIIAVKRDRRLGIGPWVTLHFECYETMWSQVQEMLYTEGSSPARLGDHLDAYNPLIPQGRELTVTVMFELDNPDHRARLLGRLTGIEDTLTLTIGPHMVKAMADSGGTGTRTGGKTAAIHFLHLPLTDEQAQAFKDHTVPAVIGFTHPDYHHMAGIPAAVRTALSGDLA